ncbi:hypothetical protein [Methylovulum miyakonense]|uniref:hypothetical protein n=1 Tax=Methylovulum miyakonense TaxID=645578 RepID=UPI0005905ED2|nr:hypothetical protein [Methylovulum miyakonense]
MSYRNLIIIVPILLLSVSLAHGCKKLALDAWLEMTPEELSQHGCVKDHVELEIFSLKGNALSLIKIANRLDQKGLLDKSSLQRKAEALYKLGRFQEALDVRILSLSKPKKCEVFVECLWEFTDAVVHYENARYYRAAKYLYKAEEELNAGDFEFDKSCPRSGKSANYCIGMRERLLEEFIPKH